MKNLSSILVYVIMFLFYELFFRLLVSNNFFSVSLFYIITYSLVLTSILYLISLISKPIINKIILYTVASINILYIFIQICIDSYFKQFFSFNLLNAGSQLLDYKSEILGVVINNIWILIILLIPLILLIIFRKKIVYEEIDLRNKLITIGIVIITILLFTSSLFINKSDTYSGYNLYFNYHQINLSLERLGLNNSLHQDIFKSVFNFKEKNELINIQIEKEDEEAKEILYDYNYLEIDFRTTEGNNETINQMNTYFENSLGTLQNKYTGYFEDKNLIMIMAESYTDIVVDEVRTPTLYKLINEGFYFENFYSPTINSTIGGEFQMLTGLYPGNGFLDTFKSGNTYFPSGISTVFEEKGYNTYAYHNNTYTFQNRDKYLKSLGFDNYKGCYNGLEKLINCSWLASDEDMFDATISDYVNNDEPFMAFYATVSGHGEYSIYHEFGNEYKNLVSTEYSEKTRTYLAAQIELDRALESLIENLEANNKLKDTVIVLAGDHYPYTLSFDEINEASSYYKDPVIKVNKSNLIIWNSEMEKITVEKVGSQIDIIPTVYNLFNIPYDSRLYVGNDILSTAPGLAIFGNRSWVSDYGSYNSVTGTFNKTKDIEDDYVTLMNQIVSSRINISGLIMTTNYYKYIF